MAQHPERTRRARLKKTSALVRPIALLLATLGGTASASDAPPPDQFAISIGDSISDGFPSLGAGNIETPGVTDVYTFTAVPGNDVFFDVDDTSDAGIRWALQVPTYPDPEADAVWVSVTDDAHGTHRLASEDYRIVASGTDDATGTYGFQLLRVLELPSVPDDTAPFELPDNISCDDGASEGDADTRILIVRPDLGEPIICTSDAEDQPVPDGTIVVRASTDDPTDDARFEFDVLGTIATIAANDSFTLPTPVEADDSVSHPVLLLGPLAGWELVSVECDDADSANRSHGSVPD